ncbi:helix-turn-helix domain-containing protein [Tumebacillus avium]|nr:helix-turn-helix domain-containing protein [Tumebacillus avium]
MKLNVNIQKLGNKLRELRVEKGLSQRELAGAICSSSTVSQIENGTYPSIPSVEILNGLCEKLGTTLGELFVDADLDSEALENDVLIDILTVLLHRGEFDEAQRILNELDTRQNLLVYQKNKLMICHGDYLLKQGEYHQAVDYLTNFQHQLESKRETDGHLLTNIYNRIGTAWYLLGNMCFATKKCRVSRPFCA